MQTNVLRHYVREKNHAIKKKKKKLIKDLIPLQIYFNFT